MIDKNTNCRKSGYKSTIIPIFVTLTLIYPFVHNTLIYSLNYLFSLAGIDIGIGNVFLLGWKDAILMFLSILLILKRQMLLGVFCVSLVSICIYKTRIDALKELVLPFVIVVTYVLYKNEIINFVRMKARAIWKILVFAVAFILIVGYVDYSYRVANDINQETWTKYDYLVLNNKYRCAKYFVYGLDEAAFDKCIYSRLNFYKISYKDGNYSFHHALFLPIGDSVVFSFILLYFLILLILWKRWFFYMRWRNVFIFSLLAYSVFLSFSRISSFVILLIAIMLFLLGRRTIKNIPKYILLLAVVVFLYFNKLDYLLLSLFDTETPSNLGHIAAVEALLNIQWYRVLLYIAIIAIFMVAIIVFLKRLKSKARIVFYYTIIVLIYISMFKFTGIQLSSFLGSTNVIPTESNFIKILVNYGLLGVIIYSYLLAFILNEITNLAKMFVFFYKNKLYPCGESVMLIIMGGLIFLYQFFSPYAVSGYVVFSIFVSILVISSKLIEEKYVLAKQGSVIPDKFA